MSSISKGDILAKSKTKADTKKTAKVLVTGASGFLGLHLTRVLREAGLYVRSLGRLHSPTLEALGVDQRLGSVLDSEACLDAATDVDAVYHLAGMVSRSPENASDMYTLHVQGVRNVLNACQSALIDNILVVSTSGTVGVSENPEFRGREDALVPWSIISRWPYYESKAFAEKEVARFVERGLPVRIARPSLLLGPGDVKGGSTHDVVRFLCGHVQAALPGGLNFVDVRDVAAILPVLMDNGAPGVGYLLGGVNCSVREFLVALEQVSGVAAPKLSVPRALAKRGGLLRDTMSRLGGLDSQTFDMGCHYWYLDTERAQSELGFKPRDWLLTMADTVADIEEIGLYSPRM